MFLLNKLKLTFGNTHQKDHTLETCKESAKDFFPLGRVPNVGQLERRRNCIKINRYLGYQNRRLKRHLSAGNYEAVAMIFLILLKNSISYQVTLIHRCKTNWY